MQWGYTMSGMKMGNTRMKLLAGAVMFLAGASLATSAMSTTLYGGGATLPAGGYVGWNWGASQTRLTPDASKTPAVTVDPASMFGAWAGSTNAVQYCQTGSGGGKRVLDGDTVTAPSLTPTGTCGDFLTGGVANAGFQIPSTASSSFPDFVGSDAPISSSEYGTFVTNNGTAKGEPIQFPAVAGSIAVIYRNDSLSAPLNLTTTQVCKIFDGEFTNWTDINPSFASKPINVVFRSDGSGTTYNLMNNLNHLCSAIVPTGTFFAVDQTFASDVAFAGHVLPIGQSTWPGIKTPANGNPAVVSAVAGSDGAIGYAEAANVKNGGGASVQMATINGFDPVNDLPATFNLPSGSVVFDKTTGVDSSTGAATLAARSPNTTANCLAVVDPNQINNLSGTYPLVAVSYILANQKGNSTRLTSLRSFINFLYTHAGVTTIGTGTGYAFIGNAGINSLKVTSCTAS